MNAMEFFKNEVQKEFRRLALEAGQRKRELLQELMEDKMAKMGLCKYCGEDSMYEYEGYWIKDGDDDIWVCSMECEENVKKLLKQKESEEEE